MKRVIAALFTLALGLLAFTGCGDAQSASQPASEQLVTGGGGPGTMQADVSEPEAGSASLPVASASGGASQSGATSAGTGDASDAAGQEVTVVNGIIDDSGMGKIYVELEDGVVVGFDFTTADISGLTDTMPGAPVTVTYSGTLNGSDTGGITVIKMETP